MIFKLTVHSRHVRVENETPELHTYQMNKRARNLYADENKAILNGPVIPRQRLHNFLEELIRARAL